jgi:hypothetical protein
VITINPDLAEVTFDVERMKAFYANWGIDLRTTDAVKFREVREGGRKLVEKACVRCEELRPGDQFRQVIQRMPDGTVRSGQRVRVCMDCEAVNESKKNQAKTKRAYTRRQPKAQVCKTCGVKKDPENFVPADPAHPAYGFTEHCLDCRRDLRKPPYGVKTCPGCDQEKHQQEFRTKADGTRSVGRPFVDCLDCRAEAETVKDARCTVCAGTGRRKR